MHLNCGCTSEALGAWAASPNSGVAGLGVPLSSSPEITLSSVQWEATTENLCSSYAERSQIAVLFHVFLSLPVLLLPVHFNSASLCEPSLTPWQSPLLCHNSTIHFVLNASIFTQYLLILYKYFVWQRLFPLSVQGESGTVYIWWSLRDRYALGWTWGFDSWDTDSTQSESSEVTRCPLVVAVTVTTAPSNGPNWPPLSMTLAAVPSLSSSENVQLVWWFSELLTNLL